MATAAAAAVAISRRRIASMKETALKHVVTNIDEALVYIRTGDIDDPRVYSKICMKLGSSIDAAIAMNSFPSQFHLPQLVLIVKEVYRRKTELMQPSLMLLMLPIKAACQVGWFPDGDKDALLMMAKEVSYGFSCTEKMNIEPSNAHSTVLNIVSRFYPTMKVENILTSLDVKAGYGTFVADFHISLGTTPRNCQKLWLIVAQLDNMETSACITSPLKVDFLINGCGVPNRTKNAMGKGPQLPSDITKLVKYGVNLLQVFGEFDGQYIIALAFMNSISAPDPSQLQDYLHPMPDCAVIEMSSQISLYCPISRHRIKTPVKGHLCKHPQCFDYNYFIEVNSIKPTWECPLCNNPVCNLDLRIDQDFLKILNEVPKDVDDVIISEDGSWMVADTDMGMMSQATVTPSAVSLCQTQVDVCTTTQAQSTTVLTPPAVSPGNVYTTMQPKSETMLTPPAGSPDRIRVDVCTTTRAESMFTPSPVSPVNVYTTTQVKHETMLRPPAGSPDQNRVNFCTSNQAKSTSMLIQPATVATPAVSPVESRVNVGTTTQVKNEMILTPPAGSPDQTRVNFCTSNQAQSTNIFTQPATVTTPAVSPVQGQVNVCTTTQTKSTTTFTPPASGSPHSFAPASNELRKGGKQSSCTKPGESQPAPSINRVSPTQLPKASGDAMPSGRMRGSLTGDRLEAARIQYLTPPQQPARANEPWSRPPMPTFPLAFMTPQTPKNSENV